MIIQTKLKNFELKLPLRYNILFYWTILTFVSIGACLGILQSQIVYMENYFEINARPLIEVYQISKLELISL
jgi:hypothetical protein